MATDQIYMIFQFCGRLVMMLMVMIIATRLARLLSRPRGTYGAGLPERRSRPRLVLHDPAIVAARLKPGVSVKAA